MATIASIKAKIKILQKQHDAIIAKDKAEIIADIKQKIAEYNITAAELGIKATGASSAGKAAKPNKSKATKSKPKPLYRGPNNEEWGGGKGARPKWIKAILESGGDIEAYRIEK